VLLPQLRRVRWAVRATLVLGVAASVVANVLHALDNPISQAIAAWPPCALLLTVELISRVPVHRKSLAFCRLLATAIIAGIAAWVSYWHMASVAARYGETGASPYLLPLSVDGLIVVASICLVELGSQISTQEAEARTTTKATQTQPTATPAQPTVAQPTAAQAQPTVTQPAVTQPAPAPQRTTPPTPQPIAASAQRPAVRATAPASASTSASTANRSADLEAAVPGLIPVPAAAKPTRRSTADALAEVAAALTPPDREKTAFTPTVTRQPRTPAPPRRLPESKPPKPTKPAATTSRATNKAPATATRSRRTPAETVAAAAKIKAARPEVTETQLAAELGISASRWRTIRRESETTPENLRLAA